MPTQDPTKIFPAENFQLKMRFERGSPDEFFQSSSGAEDILAERASWIDDNPQLCTALLPDGAPLLEEVLELAAQWKTLPPSSHLSELKDLSALQKCQWLGKRWVADYLLLVPDAGGVFRLRGGALCFPSHWDLRSKLGRTVAEIHQPVPALNSTLGRSIDGFLSKIRPGISWERHNWGLSRSPELNQHPERNLPRLDESVNPEEIWWRLEDQSLVALPNSGGVLFGIRVSVHPLKVVLDHPAAREGLRQAIRSMPDEMAAYKGFLNSRDRILKLLAC